ncbi:DNA cytosine methyltransferase [Paenibacillus polymyxa]|uniref:DNA cytosine methyltransferase n=1 Tax=Paenibacillus polymyxa TaxID=1406 RepID=UPI0006934B40|nr:DNA cytosine methyltransferase [Paenibacillus polymyxa]
MLKTLNDTCSLSKNLSWNFKPVSPETFRSRPTTPRQTERPRDSFGNPIYRDLQLFAGIGGGSLGFKTARGEYGGEVGRFENIIGIDADPGACLNYEQITGSRAVQMDLFSRKQYIDFHGVEPPESWREITGYDLLQACGFVYPDVVFTSPPCKGFSGLLPEKSASTKKYMALNELTIRGIELCLEAFQNHLPGLFIMENVPRIKTRGKHILNRIVKLLQKHGYIVAPEEQRTYDAGAFGELGQTRKRYLMVARLQERVHNYLHLPERKSLKSLGDILRDLPFPGDVVGGGPMNRIQNLAFKTWKRLALIPAGGDWRDLNQVDYERLRLVHEQDEESLESGVSSIPDLSLQINGNGKKNLYRVQRVNDAAACITGSVGPSNGAACFSDPCLTEREGRHPGVYRVVRINEPCPCVTGTRFGSGAPAMIDPRVSSRAGRYTDQFRMQDPMKPAATVTSVTDVQSGAQLVADHRDQAVAYTKSLQSHTFPADDDRGVWIIIAEDGTWHRPLTTFELAMLQGFPQYLRDGRLFQLIGSNSDATWRTWIGNAVPPKAARAIAEEMLITLMASERDDFLMSWNDIWVLPTQEDTINHGWVH